MSLVLNVFDDELIDLCCTWNPAEHSLTSSLSCSCIVSSSGRDFGLLRSLPSTRYSMFSCGRHVNCVWDQFEGGHEEQHKFNQG